MATKLFEPNEFDYWFKAKIKEIDSSVENAVRIAVEDGAQVMKSNIQTGGTKKPWGGGWRGRKSGEISFGNKSARVDSGDMLNDVDSAITESTPSRVVGMFGWIRKQEEYYRFQEYGFRHFLTREMVEPMNALRDAFTHAKNVMEKELRKALKK